MKNRFRPIQTTSGEKLNHLLTEVFQAVTIALVGILGLLVAATI